MSIHVTAALPSFTRQPFFVGFFCVVSLFCEGSDGLWSNKTVLLKLASRLSAVHCASPRIHLTSPLTDANCSVTSRAAYVK